MKQKKQNYKILLKVILLVLEESKKSDYLPEWLYNFWHTDSSNISGLKEDIQSLFVELEKTDNRIEDFEIKLIERLDLERYVAAVHLADEDMRSRIQDAMFAALFFSTTDIDKYHEYVLAEQKPLKFIHHINRKEEFEIYKSYLLQHQSVYGRFIKNFTEEEIDLAAKGHMINGKLLEHYGLEKFLKHGFAYIKKELKALQINKIEQGYLNAERINSYMEKIAFLLHPANELHQNPEALVKNARYILEDIINTAGLKAAGIPIYSEHKTIILGCYWVDEMFKVASASVQNIY